MVERFRHHVQSLHFLAGRIPSPPWLALFLFTFFMIASKS
jgi:hypothetical protein